jgi:environmental stress-induced protein Ves
MNILQAVPATRFREQPWANGAGRTVELAAGPDPQRWQWRISLARIEQPGVFSAFAGVRRQLAPLDGGLLLDFADGRHMAAQRLQVLHFDGDPPPACRLPDGPGRDFNLMLRDGFDGALLLRPLLGRMLLSPQPATRWFVYLLAGSATLAADDERLIVAAGEAAWACPVADSRVTIDGAGEIALVRLTDLA